MTVAPPTRRFAWKAPLAVFLTGLAVAAMFWLLLPASIRTARSTDYLTAYEPAARNLLAGHGLTTDPASDELATHYPPGYTLILAGILQAAHTLHLPENLLLQLLAFAAHALTAVFIFQIAASIWSRRFALIPALLWITYLPALWFTAVLNSEVAFTPVFYAALLLFWRQLRSSKQAPLICFLIGLAIGAAMLIRPIAIAAALILAALWWGYQQAAPRRQRAAAIAALLLGNLLAVLPWQIHAYAQTGRIILLSTGGLPSIIDGLTYALPDPTRPDVSVPGDVSTLMQETQHAYASRHIQSVSGAFAWLAEQATQRPLAVAQLLALKAARSWHATDSHRHERLLLILQIPYLLAGLLGIILALRWHGPARQLATLSLLFLVYFWGMTILVLSLLRYMVPAMPLLFLLIPGLWVFHKSPSRGKLPLQIASRDIE